MTDDDALARIRSAASAVDTALSVHRQAQTALLAEQAKVGAAEKTALAQLDAANAKLDQAKTGARAQEIEVSRHKVKAAQVALDEAMKSASRARELYEAGALALVTCEAAETKAALARQDLEAATDAYDLVRSGPRPVDIALAQKDVEIARRAVDEVRAGRMRLGVQRLEVVVAQTRVQEARAALAVARAALADLVLKAPNAGRIQRKNLERGDIATPATPVLEIVDARGTEVEGELGDADASKAVVGDEVTVTAANYPGREFRGRITQVAAAGELKPDVSVRTRIVRIRVRLESPDPGFMAGTQVDIEGKSVVATPVLVVPSDAMAISGTNVFVWVISKGKVSQQSIRIGRTTPQWIEILAGVGAGDRVVVKGKERLVSGQTVRVEVP